ncbi:hypothetical protein Q5752_004807 [Cryptotrichosporon argae]
MSSVPPGARPPRARILRQPLALSVAESSTSGMSSAPASEAAALRAAAARKKQLERRVESYMDAMMESVMALDTFRKAVAYLQPAQYAEVAHERHLNSLCSYPPCARRPAAAYRAATVFRISARAHTITPRAGNADDGFCGRACEVRSRFVEGQLSEESVWIRTAKVGVTLAEDVEAQRQREEAGKSAVDSKAATQPADAASATQPQARPTQPLPAPHPHGPAVPAARPPALTLTPPTQAQAQTPPLPPPAAIPEQLAELVSTLRAPRRDVAAAMGDLMAGLTIHERATPPGAPAAPSLERPSPSAGVSPLETDGTTGGALPLPLPLPAPLPASKTAAPASASPTARRARAALLPAAPKGLAAAVVNASKGIRATQAEADSDEASASEEEWAKDMGWGEGDDEVDALFEAARAARELE